MKNKLLTMLIVLSLIGIVSAFPYQLFPNGTLIDLNGTNISGTPIDIILFNGSIYLIEKNLTTINQTIIYQNITQNITYVNMTCLNCTNYYNETINNSYFSYNYGYNNSYIDENFLKLSNYNSWKDGLSYATKSELNSSVSNIQTEKTSTTWLWLSILGVFLIEFGIITFIITRSRE